MPSKAELKSICASININSEQVFSEQATREMFFETQVIGLEALQARFLDVRRTLTLEALEYVPITGAVLNNRLVRAGLYTCLTVRDDFQTRIALHDAGLNGLSVVVRANGVPGLGFEVYREDAEVYQPWVALSDLHVERLVEHLLHKLS